MEVKRVLKESGLSVEEEKEERPDQINASDFSDFQANFFSQDLKNHGREDLANDFDD